MISRRHFLYAAAVAAAATACAADPPRTLTLAAGEEGGLYLTFAEALAAVAARSGPVRITPVSTSGSVENRRLLARGEVDLALSLADSAVADPDRGLSIGRVYENYLQLAVTTENRAAAPTLASLRGRRVNLGADGSGAAFTGRRLLIAAGLDPETDLDVSLLPLADAVSAVLAGRIDALMWAGGIPTPALASPRRLTLVPLGDEVTAMRTRFGFAYDRVVVPASVYEGTEPTPTIGTANILLTRPDLSDAEAGAVVRLLVDGAADLVPAGTLGTQFLDRLSLPFTSGIPLHPGAARAYRELHG